MKRLTLSTAVLTLLAATTFGVGNVHAQAADESEPAAQASEKEWYYGSSAPETKPLGRQKAEMRARQRMARLESMRWYGFSASRPQASGIPFTTMYSPKWTRPGGRPFAWYISQRPVVEVSPYYYPRRYFR